MIVRNKENWKHVIRDKSPHQIAQQIIGDLVGYRSTSSHRADDTACLCYAIEALLEMAKEGDGK